MRSQFDYQLIFLKSLNTRSMTTQRNIVSCGTKNLNLFPVSGKYILLT